MVFQSCDFVRSRPGSKLYYYCYDGDVAWLSSFLFWSGPFPAKTLPPPSLLITLQAVGIDQCDVVIASISCRSAGTIRCSYPSEAAGTLICRQRLNESVMASMHARSASNASTTR